MGGNINTSYILGQALAVFTNEWKYLGYKKFIEDCLNRIVTLPVPDFRKELGAKNERTTSKEVN